MTNDYMAMQGLAAAGVGVALLPRLAVAIARRPGVVTVPLAEPVIERVTFVATRRGAYRSPAADAFSAVLADRGAGRGRTRTCRLSPTTCSTPWPGRPSRRGRHGWGLPAPGWPARRGAPLSMHPAMTP